MGALGELNGADVRIVAAAETAGLVVSDLGARAVGGVEDVTFEVLDVRYRPIAPGQPSATLAAVDAQNQLRMYVLDGDELEEVTRAPVALGFAAEGLCLGRNATDGLLYAFVTGRDGQLSQYLLHHDKAGTFGARLSRGLHLSSEATFCVADDAAGHVYVAARSRSTTSPATMRTPASSPCRGRTAPRPARSRACLRRRSRTADILPACCWRPMTTMGITWSGRSTTSPARWAWQPVRRSIRGRSPNPGSRR